MAKILVVDDEAIITMQAGRTPERNGIYRFRHGGLR